MSLLERPVQKLSPAPDARGIFVSKREADARSILFGSSLEEFYDDEKPLGYDVDYRIVGDMPNVVISFAMTNDGRDASVAFQEGCFNDDGKQDVYSRELPVEFYLPKDFTFAEIFCIGLTTDLSVSQIITRGFDRITKRIRS